MFNHNLHLDLVAASVFCTKLTKTKGAFSKIPTEFQLLVREFISSKEYLDGDLSTVVAFDHWLNRRNPIFKKLKG